MVVDLDVDATTVEVGTAAPRTICRLVVLTSVVGELADSANVSRALADIAQLTDSGERAERLTRLGEASGATVLQRLRLRHLEDLERRGVRSKEWWDALGSDCVIAGQDDLRGVEGRLAAACRDSLTSLLSTEIVRERDVAPLFLAFYAECEQRAGAFHSAPIERVVAPATVVDREAEVRSVLDFLDNRTAVVLDVNGLPQIGKSSVLDKALTQSGIAAVFRILLTATSSADYILYTILKRGSGLPVPPVSRAS